MKLHSLFVKLALVFTPFLCSAENSFKTTLPNNKTLEIQIPKTHKLGHKDTQFSFTYEYVLEKETIDNWSELVTVMKIPGCKELGILLSNMHSQKSLSEKQANLARNDLNFGKENGIFIGNHIVDQPSWLLENNQWKVLENTNELFYMRALQGKDEVWAIQYTIRYPKGETSSKEKDKLIYKIEAFMDKAISIQDNK